MSSSDIRKTFQWIYLSETVMAGRTAVLHSFSYQDDDKSPVLGSVDEHVIMAPTG